MNLNEWRSGQQSRSRLQIMAQRAQAVAPQTNDGGRNFATSSIGHVPRQPSEATENTELKTSMIAASPSLFRAWRFWASPTHPREAESDSFLAWDAKTNRGLRPCTPSPSSSIVVVSPGLREMLRYSDRKKDYARNTLFSDRTRIRRFPPN